MSLSYTYDLPAGVSDYPYRQIAKYCRTKMLDGKEHFWTIEQWTGVTRNGTSVFLSSMADL